MMSDVGYGAKIDRLVTAAAIKCHERVSCIIIHDTTSPRQSWCNLVSKRVLYYSDAKPELVKETA